MMRRLLSASSMAMAMLVLVPAPASATVVRFADTVTYQFSYGDCGFIVDGVGEFSAPRGKARVGKGDDVMAFFGHDNYTRTETHTRRGTGAALVITSRGLVQDVQATRVSGSIFEFTTLDITHVEITRPDGTVILREDGQVRRTGLFDTLGDATPGGVHLELLSEEFYGRFPDFDFCAAFS